MTSSSQHERRASARLVDSIQFKLGFDGFDVAGDTINISSTGLLCFVPQNIPVMSKVKMGLVLPSRVDDGRNTTIDVEGVVVRNETIDGGHRVAIFFVEISSTHRKKLETYIKAKLPHAE